MAADIPQSILGDALKGDNVTDMLTPFYPFGVTIPGYIENTLSVYEILAIFVALCTVVLGSTLTISRWTRPDLSTGEHATVLWFVLCGCIHLFFEGMRTSS